MNSAFSRMNQNMSWDLQQGNWPQLSSQSSICKYRVPCNYFIECREIHAGFCKTRLVIAATACEFWNVMNGLFVAAHTQQLSTEKPSMKFYKKYPVSKMLYTELFDIEQWRGRKKKEQEFQWWSETKYKNAKTEIPFTHKNKRDL